jgi:hypothetical protein
MQVPIKQQQHIWGSASNNMDVVVEEEPYSNKKQERKSKVALKQSTSINNLG